MGGDQNDPPLLKSIKMIQTWKKGMFWQNLIILAHYLCIWSWIITIFDPKKDPKSMHVYTYRRVPLWIVYGKNCRLKQNWLFGLLLLVYSNISSCWWNRFYQYIPVTSIDYVICIDLEILIFFDLDLDLNDHSNYFSFFQFLYFLRIFSPPFLRTKKQVSLFET